MGACRQTQDIFYYIKIGNWKRCWYLIRNFDKLTFQDTFGKFPCMLFGHKYSIRDFWEEGEGATYSCNRCHRYINDYKPQLEGLSINDTKMIKWIEEEIKQNVDYKIIDDYIKVSWRQFGSEKYPLIKRAVEDYLKWRLMEFYYGSDKQFVYFYKEDSPRLEQKKKEWNEVRQREFEEIRKRWDNKHNSPTIITKIPNKKLDSFN
jgi:hypothetical protein